MAANDRYVTYVSYVLTAVPIVVVENFTYERFRVNVTLFIKIKCLYVAINIILFKR